jgi:2-methylcitrate dehydratase PrpD
MQAHAEGKPALPVQIANAARAAVAAADLAELGMDGPRAIFEGPYGYFPLFETRADLEPVVADLGRAWRIAEVSHKPFPTGRAAQGGIALVRGLLGRGVTPDALAEATLTAPPLIERLVGRPWTACGPANYARLSFPYCGAVALQRGTVALADFTDPALADPVTAELAARIRVVSDGGSDPAAFTPQSLETRLVDGRIITARLDALPGSPAVPLTAGENRAKFEACVEFGFSGAPGATRIASEIVAAVEGLENLPDAGVLARLGAGMEG